MDESDIDYDWTIDLCCPAVQTQSKISIQQALTIFSNHKTDMYNTKNIHVLGNEGYDSSILSHFTRHWQCPSSLTIPVEYTFWTLKQIMIIMVGITDISFQFCVEHFRTLIKTGYTFWSETVPHLLTFLVWLQQD